MKNKTESILYIGISIILLVLVWEFGHFKLPNKIPSLFDVLLSIKNEFSFHKTNVIMVLWHTTLGLVISISVSLLIIIAISFYSKIEILISPILVILKATPVIAFIPLIITFVKANSNSAVIVCAALLSFFPLVIAGIDGIKRVPKKLSLFANIYNCNKWHMLFTVSRGYILESFLSGLKIAAPLSVVGTILGQALLNSKYLGAYMMNGIYTLDATVQRFTAILLISMIGSFFYLLFYTLHYWYERKNFLNK